MKRHAIRMVALGRMAPRSRQAWFSVLGGPAITDLPSAAPNGLRCGRRVLGIGVDSFAVALISRFARPASATLATNPWPGVACRVFGMHNVAVTGIYAVPGSRSWRLLRAALGSVPVVCFSEVEAAAWRREGGRATAVLWGGTTGVQRSLPPRDRVRVFVGGSSDRDPLAVDQLVGEAKEDRAPVDVVIADGTGPWSWEGTTASVRALPFVPQGVFLEELSKSQVSYLPLQDSCRAAGHMVMAASLEAGLPTVISRTLGTAEYATAALTFVDGYPGLDFLMHRGTANEQSRALIQREWQERFSEVAYITRVSGALSSLGWLEEDPRRA
jgi:hypothetical protein